MEKRLLLAVVLMTAAIMFTNLLFPPPEPPTESEIVEATDPTPAAVAVPVPIAPSVAAPAVDDSVVVTSELYRYVFATRGAALLRAELLSYPSYSDPDGSVQLIPQETRSFLAHRLVVGADTIDLASLPFVANVRDLRVSADSASRDLELTYRDPSGFGLVLRYRFREDEYLVDASGRVEGMGGQPAHLLTEVGPVLEMHEHPDHHSERELAVVLRPVSGGVDRLLFRRLDERSSVANPIAWAGIKDKYFLAAVVAGEQSPLSGVVVTPLSATTRTLPNEREVEVPRAQLTTQLPIAADGSFAFRTYVGPQDYGRLSAIGNDLEEVTPYGYRWLQPVIRPLAAAVLWVLNTLHDTLGIAYGWVLVIFGVMMRVVLWPLNARAMRAQMKNMALQPMLQELQEKYRDDKEKLQKAMLDFTREHKFNPLGGCLPLLVPMPVLITLFFVFQNTIAFRGVNFLWLPDLSLRDPLYILPIILVVSMFALQWVSARLSGMEPNPQMKMMMYMMPAVMGAIFFMLPAGLNLYYSVTQVASIPQQMLIAKERRRAQEEMKKAGKSPSAPPSGGKKKSGSKR
jgi:YidC/Oxa1 family membrane protein insertase